MVDGDPVQVVSPSQSVDVNAVNLSANPAADREVEAQARLEQHARQPFDLSRDVMLRATVVRLAENEHLLLLVIHHIAADGWSIVLFMKELSTLYRCFSTGESSSLSELPIQYTDFAAWQRQELHAEALAPEIAHWKARLEGLEPTLTLPTDRPRPTVQRFQGAAEQFEISAELADALRMLGREHESTLFMTLLSAFKVLLYRYSNQTDIVIGSPVAGRNRPEIEPLIGFFVNTIPLRTDLSGQPTFRQLLCRVREVALDAYMHQAVPFERLVEELQPHRSLGHAPLFQIAFHLSNEPRSIFEAPGLSVEPMRTRTATAKFDLTLGMRESKNGLAGRLEFCTELFNRDTIQRMADHFRRLLEGIVSDPDQPITRLPLLADAERRKILVRFNNTRTPFPRDACIHGLFEKQARSSPQAVAVIEGERALTYRQLNERANQLAHHLRHRGVAPGENVAVFMERSAEMIVAMLGILKAGAAYVPLDPNYPPLRLHAMLEDAQPRVIVTNHDQADHLTTGGATVIHLGVDGSTIAERATTNLDLLGSTDDLSYVIYTSGSTGQPKGVAVSHRAVVRLVCDTDYVALKSTDRIAQASNASFDAATFEIWGALLHGGRLVVMPLEVILSPQSFAAQLREHGITTLFVTTALFNQIAQAVPDAFRTLRHLLFGGEAVDPRFVRRVLKHGPPDRLLHVYGPTENTTFTTWYLVEQVPGNAVTVPIGKPVSNTHAYILDKDLQPVPVGVAGELYLGGEGLALGYFNRPNLTAERFIPDPFCDESGSCLYKSGDLCRYRSDGNIEFLGRFDHQVKVRGFPN